MIGLKDPEQELREYYDSIEMSDEFREKMRRITTEKGRPAKARSLAAWKPTVIAAVVVLICLSGFAALQRNGLTPFSENRPSDTPPSSSENAPALFHTEEYVEDPSRPIDADPAVTEPSDIRMEHQPTEPIQEETEPPATQPAGPEPTEPQPTEPQPTVSPPTESPPTDPIPAGPDPTEPTPTDPQPTEPQPTDPQPTEPTDESEVIVEEEAELQAVYTHTETSDYIVITNMETGETETVDVTGQVTETGFCGTFKLFGCYVFVELLPDGNGGFTASATIV